VDEDVDEEEEEEEEGSGGQFRSRFPERREWAKMAETGKGSKQYTK
jgi:hypothetical protein